MSLLELCAFEELHNSSFSDMFKASRPSTGMVFINKKQGIKPTVWLLHWKIMDNCDEQ